MRRRKRDLWWQSLLVLTIGGTLLSFLFVRRNAEEKHNIDSEYNTRLGRMATSKMMRFKILEGGSIRSSFTKIGLVSNEDTVSFRTFFRMLGQSQPFRTQFNSVLANLIPYDAFFFECPPISSETLDVPFEFVGVPARSLEKVDATPRRFPQIRSSEGKVGALAFNNLGGDAVLVVPTAFGDDFNVYGHLGRMVRGAPEANLDAFWSKVSETVVATLSSRPPTKMTWLSTSGLGVFWTHMRLDTKPKYYTHSPYREATKRGSLGK